MNQRIGQEDNQGGIAQLTLSQRGFRRLSDYIMKTLGIQMPEGKLMMLQSRLQRRARALGLANIDAYCDLILRSPSGAEELNAFISAVTTNKTDFFREPAHFRYLVDVVLRQHAATKATVPFRIWHAGCSTGEEPYTAAMVLADYAAEHAGFDFSILGTDISQRVLQLARSGMFNEEQIAPISLPLRQRYLRRGSGEYAGWYRVASELRSKLRLAAVNLMDEDYGIAEQMDVIFFRNVMIYFDKPTQAQVVRRLCRNLRPNGYLFIGHVESLAGLDVPLTNIGPAIFQRKALG